MCEITTARASIAKRRMSTYRRNRLDPARAEPRANLTRIGILGSGDVQKATECLPDDLAGAGVVRLGAGLDCLLEVRV